MLTSTGLAFSGSGHRKARYPPTATSIVTRRRNCDAAVERSSALEARDELLRLVPGDAFELEPEPDAVEDGQVRADRVPRLDLADTSTSTFPSASSSSRANTWTRLDAARRDARQEELGGRDLLARATVVDGAVDDEVVLAAVAEHAAEDVGGTGLDGVRPRGHDFRITADDVGTLHDRERGRMAAEPK